MTLYLHIGTQKTGTTSIQKLLSTNYEALKDNGILYLKCLEQNTSQWSAAFLGYDDIKNDYYCIRYKIKNKDDLKLKQISLINDIKNELDKTKPKSLIISSEHIHARLDVDELKRLKQVFNDIGFSKIKIIIYIREQNEAIISSISTAIKAGKQIPSFDTEQYDNKSYYKSIFDYEKVVKTYDDIFDEVIVRIFSKNDFYEGDLEKDFLNIFKLDYKEFKLGFYENEKLDLIGMKVLDIINKKYPYFINDNLNPLRTSLNTYINKYLKEDKEYSFNLPKSIALENKKYFQKSNQYIQTKYFPHKKTLFDKSIIKEDKTLSDNENLIIEKITNFFLHILDDKEKLPKNQMGGGISMQNISLNEIKNIAIKAGDEVMKIYKQDFKVSFKDDKSPLTMADLKANEIICNELSKYNLPIISEENKQIPYEIRKTWEYYWCIDPIDGTKEFINKNDEFSINIALIHKNKPVLGVVYAPALKLCYSAKEGIGAFRNDKAIPFKDDDGFYKVVASKSHLNDETKKFINEIKTDKKIKLISMGSSLKLCLVASNEAQCYPRLGPTMEWDTAAADAIVRIAGKMTYDYTSNKALVYNKENLLNPYFVVK